MDWDRHDADIKQGLALISTGSLALFCCPPWIFFIIVFSDTKAVIHWIYIFIYIYIWFWVFPPPQGLPSVSAFYRLKINISKFLEMFAKQRLFERRCLIIGTRMCTHTKIYSTGCFGVCQWGAMTVICKSSEWSRINVSESLGHVHVFWFHSDAEKSNLDHAQLPVFCFSILALSWLLGQHARLLF